MGGFLFVAMAAVASISVLTRSDPAPAAFVILVDRAASDDPFAWHFCNGVLIGPASVLTAAHCVEGRSPDSIDVVADVRDLCASTSQKHRSQVLAVRRHPQWEHGGQTFDIAELELDRPMPVDPLPIGSTSDATATAFSWTDPASGLPGCALRSLDFTLGDAAFCALAVGGQFDASSMLCATRPDTSKPSLCSGDSGGPLIDRRGSTTVILGLVSWAWSCDGTGPEVFARAIAF